MVEGITNDQRQELDAAAIQRELMRIDEEYTGVFPEFIAAIRLSENAKAEASEKKADAAVLEANTKVLKAKIANLKERRSTLQSVLRTL